MRSLAFDTPPWIKMPLKRQSVNSERIKNIRKRRDEALSVQDCSCLCLIKLVPDLCA